jgi:hypothetical protein
MSKPEMKAFCYMRVGRVEPASDRQETADQRERATRIIGTFGPLVAEFVEEDDARRDLVLKAIWAGGAE